MRGLDPDSRDSFALMTMLRGESDSTWDEVFTTLRIACDGFMNEDLSQYLPTGDWREYTG